MDRICLGQHVHQTRRGFLTSAASGLGAAALAAMLQQDGLLASAPASPLAPKAPHVAGRARRCIFIFLAGGTSQIELFDPKPELNRLSGQTLPESLTQGARFSFLNLQKSVLMGSRFGHRRYGQCGMEMSELLPHIGSCADEIALVRSMHHHAFDHAPGEVEMSTGIDIPGRPSLGAWLTYGLGSESRNLPGYVVLLEGRGPVARSMAWGSSFLPSICGGVLFRNKGEPVLNLENPPGLGDALQRGDLDAVRRLNELRFQQTREPEIANRIAAYELAYRMQSAAPELIDLRQEARATRTAYGVDRGGEAGVFATNCLLARRLAERGVRFVSIFQRRWDQHKDLDRELTGGCRIIDQPIGALLQDLKRRGLLEDTLVVCGTEFGRTPLTENAKPGPGAGRDHHPFAFSVWLAGGGVKGGQVIGKTDDFSWNVTEEPVHVNDFHATLLRLFGLDHLKLTYRFKGLDYRLTDVAGKVVTKLLA